MPIKAKDTKVAKVKTKKATARNIVKRRISQKNDIDSKRQDAFRRIKRRERRPRRRRRQKDENEGLDIRLVSIRRVAKTRAGGKRLRLSVMLVVGDTQGRIGIGVAKGKDVRGAQEKALRKAKKKMFKVPLRGETIPHEITTKFHAAKVFLKPAAPGTGVIAGHPVRAVVEAAGVKDILSKELGSKNPISNVYATFKALKSLRLTRAKDEARKTHEN